MFDIDPNGRGGFLETTLVFDPSFSVGISDTTFVYDFANGANANAFVADGLLNLNTFFGLSDGGQFCTELHCATVLQDISFADNAGLNDHGLRSRDRSPGVNRRPRTRHMGAHDGRTSSASADLGSDDVVQSSPQRRPKSFSSAPLRPSAAPFDRLIER